MTIYVEEQADSRKGKGSMGWTSSQTRHFNVRGSTDPATIVAAVFADAKCPASVVCPVNTPLVLYRSDVQYSPLTPDHASWDVVVEYEDPEQIDDKQQVDTGSYTFSVSTTGGTARILSSLATINRYAPPGKTAPNFKQAIGVTREGDVQGVDIIVPACKFTMSYRQPKHVITTPYVRLVESITGTVNNATFYGRAAGEVLFAGGNGRQGTNSDPTWDYEFIRLPNIAGQTIGEIINVAKKGHEYLWVLFEESADPTAKYTVKKPKAVYVERVYLETNFGVLGIGV